MCSKKSFNKENKQNHTRQYLRNNHRVDDVGALKDILDAVINNHTVYNVEDI